MGAINLKWLKIDNLVKNGDFGIICGKNEVRKLSEGFIC